MICCANLEQGVAQYKRLGFNVQSGGTHPGKGTHNAIAFNEPDYVELLAIRDPAEEKAASGGKGSWGADLPGYIKAGGGIRFVILQSDDLAADVAAMKGRGVDVSDVVEGRRQQDAVEFKWKSAFLGPKNPLPLFFIQHLTSLEARKLVTRHPSPVTEAGHPNGVRFLERTYIVVHDLEASVAMYSKVLGVSEPRMYKGTVIMSHMAVFQFGKAGLTIAHPYAPGPASISLEKRGEGPS